MYACLLLGIGRTTNSHKGDFAFDLSEGLDHGNQFTEGQLPTLLRCHVIIWTRKMRLVTGLEQLVALGHEAKKVPVPRGIKFFETAYTAGIMLCDGTLSSRSLILALCLAPKTDPPRVLLPFSLLTRSPAGSPSCQY